MKPTACTILIGSLFVVAGCFPPGENKRPDPAPDATAPAKDVKYQEYVDWQPTEQQIEALAKIHAGYEGKLKPLFAHTRWSGNRLHVVSMREGGLTEKKTGKSWHVAIIPRSGESIVDIKGVPFPDDFEIAFDTAENQLIVDGVALSSKEFSGKSQLFPNATMEGLTFKGRGSEGRTETAGIFLIDDSQIYIDFHNLTVNGSKAGEFGLISPVGQQ